MAPEIETLKKLSAQKIGKGKVEALQQAYTDAYGLFERLCPSSEDEDTLDDFEGASSDLESALDDLDSAISDLDMAEDKDEREDAISMIEDALDETISAFEAIMPFATVGTTARERSVTANDLEFDPEVARQLLEIAKLPEPDRASALSAWVQSAGLPAQVEERQKKLDQLFDYLDRVSTPKPPG